jgi:DNA mismatch repair protein MutS2
LEGAFLNEEEFFQLKQTLTTFLSITKYFKDRTGIYPNLESILEGLIYNDITIKKIDKIIDLEAKLRPNASPELARISAKLNEKEKDVRRIINRIYEKANDSGWLADSGITIRDGQRSFTCIGRI